MINKTAKEKELIKEFPEFNKHHKAILSLSEFLKEKDIKFLRSEEQVFHIIIKEKPTEELRNLIKSKIKEIQNKLNLYSYSEGLSNFTYGF